MQVPAFEGSDICSGLVAGDVLVLVLNEVADSDGAQFVECDASLGFAPGASVQLSLSHVVPGELQLGASADQGRHIDDSERQRHRHMERVQWDWVPARGG